MRLTQCLIMLCAAAALAAHAVTADAGDVLVTGWSSNNVNRYDETGAFIAPFAPAGTGGLSNAHSLTQGPDGMVYVTSAGSDAVLRFDPVSAAVETFVAPGAGGMGSLVSGWSERARVSSDARILALSIARRSRSSRPVIDGARSTPAGSRARGCR